MWPVISDRITFDVEILQQINTAPFFTINLNPPSLDVNNDWLYVLPKIVDKENDLFNVTFIFPDNIKIEILDLPLTLKITAG